MQKQNNSAALSVMKTVNAATPLIAGLESVFPFLCFLKNGAKFVCNKNWRNLNNVYYISGNKFVVSGNSTYK